jgi:hypothetical protein
VAIAVFAPQLGTGSVRERRWASIGHDIPHRPAAGKGIPVCEHNELLWHIFCAFRRTITFFCSCVSHEWK